jgi:hypothetical protein
MPQKLPARMIGVGQKVAGLSRLSTPSTVHAAHSQNSHQMTGRRQPSYASSPSWQSFAQR